MSQVGFGVTAVDNGAAINLYFFHKRTGCPSKSKRKKKKINNPTSSQPASKKKNGKQLRKQSFKPINDKENQELFSPKRELLTAK